MDRLRYLALGLVFALACGSGGTAGNTDKGGTPEPTSEVATDTPIPDSGPGEEVTTTSDTREEPGAPDVPEVFDIPVDTPDTPAEVKECTADADCAGRVPRLAACEIERCDPATWTCGKAAAEDGTACDDGNPCTSPDTCTGGVCGGGTNACDCDKDEDCETHEDGNLCNGTLVCDKSGLPFKCVVDPKSVVDCGDDLGLPCRSTACEPATGKCLDVFTHEGESCDDGNPCTTGDVCGKGECLGAATVTCNDDNPCTDDACVFGQGCVYVNNTVPCDDGEICTVGDSCAEGKCVPGLPDPCDDANPCTLDACKKGVGCGHEGISGPACEDGDLCTTGESCADGFCTGGQVANCDDQEICTDDSCDPAKGCVHAANTLLCDDGDGCTLMDRCWDGACAGGPAVDCDDLDPCTADSCDNGVCIHDPADCDDLDACTVDSCSPETGECFHGPKDCWDGNACTEDACDPETGACVNAPLSGTPCDDKDLCSDGDACLDGTCVPGTMKECPGSDLCHVPTCTPATGECLLDPVDCEDGDPCTLDECRPSDGLCERVVKVCDDGDVTTDDYCETGTGDCRFIPKACKDDKDPCTIEKLDPLTGNCAYLPKDCGDGDPCTVDYCSATNGRCIHPPKDVSDGDPCTDDSCIPGTGDGKHVAKDCSDGNPCTRDLCEAGTGKCLHPPVDPTDGDPCTVDACDPETGDFTHVPKDCDDKNPCTDDSCNAGDCIHAAVMTDDGNPCTIDSCDKVTGTVSNTPMSCDDHNRCTTDSCDIRDGKCVHVQIDFDDEDPCTVDKCDPGTGGQTHLPKVCNDADPCTIDACDSRSGECLFVKKISDDHNPCTIDSCDPETGTIRNVPVVCDDKDACTADHCNPSDGKCVFSPRPIDDGNPCTIDSCDKTTGEVTHEPLPCDDEDLCTKDSCDRETGACVHTDVVCDDSDECTDDGCDGETGECVFDMMYGMECDDGDPCTEGDACGGVFPTGPMKTKVDSCQGLPVDCDDGDDCTADSCDGETGDCVNELVVDQPCDDGDDCTTNDRCRMPLDKAWGSDYCSGDAVDCDDSDECTDDWCDSEFGECVNDFQWERSCDDGDPCTEDDMCSLPVFEKSWEGSPNCHGWDVDCDDDNDCTSDSCDPENGNCVHVPATGAGCDDGDPCTLSDACSADGECVGKDMNCADSDQCTDDYCDADTGECNHDFRWGGVCDDGNACTVNDRCSMPMFDVKVDNHCKGTPMDCDDDNDCTADSCSAGKCVHTATAGASCDDGDDCTEGDSCTDKGTCIGTTLDCDDGDDCTADSCDGGDCYNDFQPGHACEDGDPCTIDDSCDGGSEYCRGGDYRDCDDGNDCTSDWCDSETGGCVNEVDVEAGCDDGDPCTEDDGCDAEGKCSGNSIDCDDGNDCTADSCDGGKCVNTPVPGSACDDGRFCTVNDKCDAEGGCSGSPRVCDDHNACTLDRCDGELDDCYFWPDPNAVEGPKGASSCSDGKDNDCDGKVDANDPDCLLEVAAVSPDDGPESVPATVVISGNGFDTATAVRFGLIEGTIVAKTSTTLTVSLPGLRAGRMDVTVTVASGVSATLKNGYMATGTLSVLPWVTYYAPASVQVTEGQDSGLLFGRVWDPYVTQGGDPNRILAEVCYGPPGTLPWAVTGWTCVAAAYNPSCGNCGNNYEYMASVKAPAGAWDLFYRFSLDNSVQFKYGDLNGSSDGCTSDQAAKLVVKAACVPACTGKDCGDDGCGGSCGTCTSGKECVSGKCTVTNLDVSGWVLVKSATGVADKTFALPAGTVLKPGDSVVIGRKSDKAAFETFWSRTLPSSAWYFDTADNQSVVVNGSGQFTLKDANWIAIDGPTFKFAANLNAQRSVPPAAAGVQASWVEKDANVKTNATPGTGQTSSTTFTGIYISEVADALGTGNYVYEFVELYYDGP